MGMDDNNSYLTELPWRLCGTGMVKRYHGDRRTENASEPMGSDLWTGIVSIVNTSSGAETMACICLEHIRDGKIKHLLGPVWLAGRYRTIGVFTVTWTPFTPN